MPKRYISWSEYHDVTLSLVNKLKDKNIDTILAVSLGGVSAAQILAHHLSKDQEKDHLPVEIISTSHYKASGERFSKVKIDFCSRYNFDNVLIVDDVYETGKTIEVIKQSITANQIHVAVVCNKSKEYDPYLNTALACDPNVWIVFPWEKV